MTGPVIITRAEPGNGQTAARLADAGIDYVCAPMLTLVSNDVSLPSLEGVQGLLFTSANGVRAFCDVCTRRDLTAWCVGPATLFAAREAGFKQLEHGDGNAADLAALVMDKADQRAGHFIHIANAAAAGKLAETLRLAGFGVAFAPLYRAEPVVELLRLVADCLGSDQTITVLVHSAKGARAFADMIVDLNVSRHILVAVSQAAAAPLLAHGFAKTICAARPNEAALMDALFTARSIL